MSTIIKISPYIKLLRQSSTPTTSNPNPLFLKAPTLFKLNSEKLDLIKGSAVCRSTINEEAVSVSQRFDYSPMSIQLDSISSEEEFDCVIDEARQLERDVVIVWVANWCRNWIYLKPKLEKLAAHYHPSIRFYSVDVNNVSHKLVARAEVTKMPTIQLWSSGNKWGEVIGGHKAYLVVNEVRDMIENESSSL